MKNTVVGISLLAVALAVSGCTLASKEKIRERPVEAEAVFEEGKGDAFLFDVKIRRNGKKNSVRLDVYRSGDSLSLYARGYLGKGVLKGLITNDSLVVQSAVFDNLESFYGSAGSVFRERYKVTDIIDDVCIMQPRKPLPIRGRT